MNFQKISNFSILNSIVLVFALSNAALVSAENGISLDKIEIRSEQEAFEAGLFWFGLNCFFSTESSFELSYDGQEAKADLSMKIVSVNGWLMPTLSDAKNTITESTPFVAATAPYFKYVHPCVQHAVSPVVETLRKPLYFLIDEGDENDLSDKLLHYTKKSFLQAGFVFACKEIVFQYNEKYGNNRKKLIPRAEKMFKQLDAFDEENDKYLYSKRKKSLQKRKS